VLRYMPSVVRHTHDRLSTGWHVWGMTAARMTLIRAVVGLSGLDQVSARAADVYC